MGEKGDRDSPPYFLNTYKILKSLIILTLQLCSEIHYKKCIFIYGDDEKMEPLPLWGPTLKYPCGPVSDKNDIQSMLFV